MSYIINNSRGQLLVVVPDGTVNTSVTDLSLVGRGVTEYGTAENENYVYLLENFANSTAPLQPILGQLWYNSTTDVISTYSTANTWSALASQDYVQAQKVSPAFSGTPTAPTATVNTSTTQIATTAFVLNQLGSGASTSDVLTGGNISATGTVTGSSLLGSIVSATANVTGGNISTSGIVSAGGNVIGANFIGNVIPPAGGAVSTTGNVTGGNISTSGIVSAGGNIIGSNIIGTNLLAAGLSLSSNVISAFNVTSNISGGNISTNGLISATGNITGGNISATRHTGTTVSVTGNITGGNILTSGIVSATGNITTTNTIFADTVIANTVITTGTTSAFRLPNLTQTQINALSSQNGDMVYNTTDNLPQVYQNGVWWDFTISYYS
jgi:hypothetical protein